MRSQPATRYRIEVRNPNAHQFDVRCTIDDPAPDGQRFKLPTWVPGSYLIREFARHFVAVRAENAAGPVAIDKEAKDAWRAAPCDGPLTVVATVYAYDLSVRTAYVDATRAYFNGAAVFLCPEGRENARCVVDVAIPDGAPFTQWRCATTLTRDASSAWCFEARDYDELIDHPIEIADFAQREFGVHGVAHEIALSGRQQADLDRIASDLRRICAWHIDLFGRPPPFDRYLFLAMVVGDGYGGLEHRSSTSLLVSRKSLPVAGMAEPTDDYVGFLGLASHEYFHAWNVKRIKPAAFAPYDLAREAYTRQLWAFEGITSYYDDLALARSGVITPAKYLELLGRAITNVLRTPGRMLQSLAASSFDAWIKHYRQDENSPNAGISYYAKGALVALALDLVLRSECSASLDDVMRRLWKRHAETASGIPEDLVERFASEVAGRGLREFFSRYVEGTEDPPLAELLARFGVTLNLRAATGAGDRGGKAAPENAAKRLWLGAKVGTDLRLQHVYTGGPAERAGLAPGDTLLAFDELRASTDAIHALLERSRSGARVAVHAFRRDELMRFDVELADAPHDTAWLALDAGASADALARRAGWLGPDAARA